MQLVSNTFVCTNASLFIPVNTKGAVFTFYSVFFSNTFSRLALLFVLHLLENCTTLYYKPKCTIQISNINNNAVAKTIFRINKRNFLFNKLEQFIFFKYLFWLSIDQLIVLKICLFKRNNESFKNREYF